MKFEIINLTVAEAPVAFEPFDRGAKGAFVYRQSGITLNSPRLVVSTTTDDASSDKYSLQTNTPRVAEPIAGCCDVVQTLGTDLVKTELRFLAITSAAERGKQIDTQIALLQQLRSAIMNREKLYA